MLAVDFIHSRYNEKNGYEPWVFQLNRSGVNMLKDADLSNLSFRYKQVSYNEFDTGNVYPDFKEMVLLIEQKPPDTCVFFLEQGAFGVWLNYFMKGKTRIVLAPDGNKPYYRVTRKALYSRTFETIRIYRFLARHGYRLFRFYYMSLNYGLLPGINEIWVEYPEFYQGSQQRKLVQYRFLQQYNSAHPLNDIYHFKRNELPFIENGIFYVNNILYEQYLYDIEIEVLYSLREKYPNAPMVIKYHPSTPASQVEKFRNIPGAELMATFIPFELIVANLDNCIIAGMWSNALMYDNPRCNFYWLNRYLEKRGKMLARISLINPTRHIREVEELDEIVFPRTLA